MVASSEQLRHRSNVSNTVPMQKWVDPSSGSNPSMVASSVPVLGTSQLRHRSKVWSVKTLKSRSVKTIKSHGLDRVEVQAREKSF